jgi:hypothetical protein
MIVSFLIFVTCLCFISFITINGGVNSIDLNEKGRLIDERRRRDVASKLDVVSWAHFMQIDGT